MTQQTVAKLSGELRRYLDDKAWLENRRIMEILHRIEGQAIAIRDRLPDGAFMALDEMSPDIALVMERPLFAPASRPEIDDTPLAAAMEDIPADALFGQHHVDKQRLDGQIRRALQRRSQVSLSEVVAEHPLRQGLAELVAYMSIAAEDTAAVIDDDSRQTIFWTDDDGRQLQTKMPLVIFARGSGESGMEATS